MAVYVDDAGIMFKGKPRYHLAADSVSELHAFCQKVGIARCWFHAAKGHPHYDITNEQRQAAIRLGAVAMTVRELMLCTKSGRQALDKMIMKNAGNPERQAMLLAMIPPDREQTQQQELF